MEKEKVNEKFFNAIAKFYESGLIRRWSISIQKKVVSSIKIKKNSIILDAGCGTGNLLMLLSKRKDLKLYGIDISEEMLKIASLKLKNKANLKLLSVRKINYKNKFDYIFSVDAFHHYSEQEKVMKKFYNALKKNGLLIIAEINFGFFLNKIFHLIEPGNIGMYSADELKEMFEKYNFKKIMQKKINLFSVLTVGRK